MKLSDAPDLPGTRYPERISISVSTEAYNTLQILKRQLNKDTSELIRILIDEFIAENQHEIKNAAG